MSNVMSMIAKDGSICYFTRDQALAYAKSAGFVVETSTTPSSALHLPPVKRTTRGGVDQPAATAVAFREEEQTCKFELEVRPDGRYVWRRVDE